MGAPGPWQITDALLAQQNGPINLATDTFKAILLTSLSNIGTGISGYAAVTGELQTGNGYTSGGVTLAPALVAGGSPEVLTWTVADFGWSASGGDLVSRYVAIYDDTAPGKPVICFALRDATPADYTIANGTTRSVEIAATGVIQWVRQ